MLSENPEQVLNDYRHWDAVGNPLRQCWFPPCDPTQATPGRSIPPLSEDEAEWVDLGLCRLKQKNPEAFEILRLVYFEGKKLRQIASWSRMPSRPVVERRHAEGLEFFRGVLVSYEVMRARKKPATRAGSLIGHSSRRMS